MFNPKNCHRQCFRYKLDLSQQQKEAETKAKTKVSLEPEICVKNVLCEGQTNTHRLTYYTALDWEKQYFNI